MIYSMVPFPVILSDRYPRFQGHGVIIDALVILCAQLTRDLFAIAKFLYHLQNWMQRRYQHMMVRHVSCFVSMLFNED